jgi:seryl-tRNA synthetase
MPRDSRSEFDVDPEIRALVEEYTASVKSVPPPPNKEAATKADAEARMFIALAKRVESLDRSRQNLAQQIGSSIRDSGTFEQIGQDQLDNMMLRAEVTRLNSELTRVNAENAELKAVVKEWNNRKHDWSLRVIFAAIAALAAYAWTAISASKK